MRSNDNRKRTVLRSQRNIIIDGAFLADDGKLFHAIAKATGKAQSPSVVRLVEGTTSVAESAECSQWQMSTSDVRRELATR